MFNMSINDLDDGTEKTLSKFSDDTKLGGVADNATRHAATQKDLSWLEKWTDNSLKVQQG